jgi:uncharacterized protein
MLPKHLLAVAGFQWDPGNIEKNWLKHGVSPLECEEVFFNQPLVLARDEKHSQTEERYYALGRTENDRHLFVVFTVRGKKIRVISARDMNKKERGIYGT